MTTLDASPLGKTTRYPDRYDASLLFALSRAPQRAALGIDGVLPFRGCDVWNCYEITWLDSRGRPRVGVGEIRVDAESPAMVESKSLKLYLGSFAQERMTSAEEVGARIAADLTHACGDAVAVTLSPATAAIETLNPGQTRSRQNVSIDDADTDVDDSDPDSGLLAPVGSTVDETLRTSLFRSMCPVTGQPDYADVFIRYRGPRIDHAALLRYVASFRRHAAFHEACVEQMFVDLENRCCPEQLSVYARFLRRGGIDINPFRSNVEAAPPENARTSRQ